MTREVTADFEYYKDHLRASFASADLGQQPFEAALKKVHRHFFSLLTLCLELTDADGDCRAYFEAEFGMDAISYLREVVSDIGQASHCFASGAYKAALVTIRSSIESFCKAFTAHHDPTVLAQKSVGEVFSRAKVSPFFVPPESKQALSVLLGVYDDLNLYVHTVTDAQMFNLLRLGVYPQFDIDRAKETERIYLRVVNAYVFAIVMTLKPQMYKVHYKNRENVLSALSPAQIQAFNRAGE